MALLEATNVQKIYTTRFGGNRVQALSRVSFSVEQGDCFKKAKAPKIFSEVS